jgi:hypothetical protein
MIVGTNKNSWRQTLLQIIALTSLEPRIGYVGK